MSSCGSSSCPADQEPGADLSRLPVAAQRRVEAACTRFEEWWRAGQRPQLERMLGDATGAEREVLLAELLALEIEYRQRAGQRPDAAEYAPRFPGCAAVIAQVFQEIDKNRGWHTPSVKAAQGVRGPPTSAASPASPRKTPTPAPRPIALVEGDTPHLSREIQGLLQARLRAVAVLVGGASLAYLTASYFAGAESLRFSFGQQVETILLALTMAAVGAACWTRRPLPVPWLRRIELVTFAAPALLLAHEQIQGTPLVGVLPWASEPHREDVAGLYASGQAIAWGLLIIAYGTLIPNTGRRCALVVLSLAAVPVLAELTSCRLHGTWPYLGEVLFELAVCLALACAIAIYGSHRISTLGRAEFEARKLGQYHLKQPLGSGGMGRVYLAEHKLLRRPCVVKVIRPDRCQDPTMLARFEREVHAMAQLSHWNTVEVFDYGRSADGTFYYVMEYLPGMTLGELVERHGPLQPDRAVYFLRQVCAALREAHAAGLVHRDIKPGNIMVCQRGGLHDVVKLLDFGLVQPLAGGVDSERLTVAGTIAGTPGFMSPEQAAGDEHGDARTDIYSVGAVAFFLLTGRAPFVADTPLKTLAAHLYEPVPPPSTLRPDAPADLEAVVMRCLQKDRQARFPDADSLSASLAACGCSGGWTTESAAQWWQDLQGTDRIVRPIAG